MAEQRMQTVKGRRGGRGVMRRGPVTTLRPGSRLPLLQGDSCCAATAASCRECNAPASACRGCEMNACAGCNAPATACRTCENSRTAQAPAGCTAQATTGCCAKSKPKSCC